MEEKRCTKCGGTKPLTDYYQHRRKYKRKIKLAYEAFCKDCRRKYDQGRRAAGITQPYLRWYNVLRKYGLSKEQFEAIWKNQDGKCAICGIKMTIPARPTKKTDVNVDHDHVTNKVRELLCVRCNRAIGYCEESTVLLRAMADYLDQHRR